MGETRPFNSLHNPSYGGIAKQSDEYSLLASLLTSSESGSATATGAARKSRTQRGSSEGSAAAKTPKISAAKRKLFLAIFLLLTFIGAALFSIPAPFFPSRAMQKGMSQSTAGLVLGSMQLVQFVAAIIFAFVMFHIGLKFMLFFGVIWVSTCAMFFGLLDLGPNDASYTVLCFTVRVIQGIGVSAYYISSSTMVAVLYGEKYALTVGVLSTAYSMGCLVGPSIGGALYAAGGFICPFIVMGAILMLLAPIIAVTVPSDICESTGKKTNESSARVVKTLLTPSLFAFFYTMLVGTMTTVFTETTIGVRLAQFGVVDPIIVGAVYLAASGAYGVTAPIAGHIADKYDIGWAVTFLGTVLAIIGCIAIGPSPILGLEGSLPQLIVGSLIAHCGYSCCLIPMTRELQRLAKASDLDPNHPSTLSFISAFCDCCWGMGGFLGAFLAGTLMENLGFPLATSIQALVLIPSIIMQALLMLKFGHLKKCFSRANNNNNNSLPQI